MQKKSNSVLVVGGGVVGIQAALDLAESGFSVILAENKSTLGGRLSLLDKQFPTDDCGMCKLLSSSADVSEVCLKRGVFHPNVEFVPNAEVGECTGSAGDFSVTINQRSHYVTLGKCIGCGQCVNVCPIEIADEFNGGLTTRKAIYVRCPASIPQIYTVDIERCTKCGECVKICPTCAIDFSSENRKRILNVGAVILSPGFEEFDPSVLGEYGYSRFSNIMTSTQFERALSGSGPYGGRLVRPSDNTVPRKVAFLQCIGSRDKQRDYCSSACCMFAIKEAHLLKDIYPDVEIKVFFMDLRIFGKDYYKYSLETKKRSIEFIRCRVPALEENPSTKDLRVGYETEAGELVTEEFNLAVLSVGQCPPQGADQLAKIFGIELNKFGFAKTDPLQQVETGKPGIYVCGSFREPAPIQEGIVQASAAANKASFWLYPEVPIKEPPRPAREGPAQTGIFICECGIEVSGVIDTTELIEYSKKLTNAAVAEKVVFLCLDDGLSKIRETVSHTQLANLIIGACAPYQYDPVFVRLGREFGIPSGKIEVVDLREAVAWVHKDKQRATQKAKNLIAMAYEKIRLQEEIPSSKYLPTRRVLVIGAGVSGIILSLDLAALGFEVDLIEKTAELGGNRRYLHSSSTNIAGRDFLAEILQRLEISKQIHIHKNAEVKKVEGYAGNFSAEFVTKDQQKDDLKSGQYGAIVVATGAKEYEPKEYLYGQDPRIATQRELDKQLCEPGFSVPESVVMIQCVGSLNEDHPYCSRVCCARAIENALRLKQLNPKVNIHILYREMMNYGFKEEYYTKARESGVLFVRYDLNNLPQVAIIENRLEVQVKDPILNETLVFSPRLVVLSTGIIADDNKSIARILGVPLNSDGFFDESNIKFRPLEFAVPGIFVCGLAHSPMFLEEAITQANAVCEKVAISLSRPPYLLRRQIAEVKERWCAACGLCVQACRTKARIIDETRKVAIVREAFCQGCGECAVICPNKASKLRGHQDKQIISMIEAALLEGGK